MTVPASFAQVSGVVSLASVVVDTMNVMHMVLIKWTYCFVNSLKWIEENIPFSLLLWSFSCVVIL